MSRGRLAAWLAGAVVAAVVAWLGLGSRAPGDAARTDTPAPAPAPAAAPARDRPALPAAAAGADPGAAPAPHEHKHGAEAAIPEDPGSLPAPPSGDEIAARPERRPTTPEARQDTRQAALELVERSIERLEDERRQAEAAGDTRAAERNRLRIERLRQRRDVLAAELEQAAP